MLKKSISFAVVTIGLFFYSCYDNPADSPIENKPPVTKLFLSVDDTLSQQPSKLKIYWTGDDPDGFVVGFYFSWDGINWSFTSRNDSLFALQIGAVDTSFIFRVSAADNSGNGIYDTEVRQHNRFYGSEPFTDLNKNGKWDAGEPFIDIGLIDPNPAQITIPIRNSAPVVAWDEQSTLPDTSFPVMSFGWNASDLDGDESITAIRIALNDTSNYVALSGKVGRITLRTRDFGTEPLMDILINQDVNNIFSQKLPGLIYNSQNKFMVQAVDISGAASPWITTETVNQKWYVKRPTGSFVIIDDFRLTENAAGFYNNQMDSIGLSGKYDIYNISDAAQKIPYKHITFLETLKLFKGAFWYSDYNNPSLDLANATVQRYLDAGGKLFFSMQFPAIVDLLQIQGFLPIISDSSFYAGYFETGSYVSDISGHGYPDLEVGEDPVARARSFYIPNIGVEPVYYCPTGELKGFIGFKRDNLFFIGLPLHKMNARASSVRNLMYKVIIEDFRIIP